MGFSVVAVEAGFEKSLSQTLSRIYLESFVVSVKLKEAISSIVLFLKCMVMDVQYQRCRL